MKKLTLIAAAIASLFLAASCQQDNLEPVGGGSEVTFSVTTPDVDTKATIGDGTNVNQLLYEVYLLSDAKATIQDTDKPILRGRTEVKDKKATVRVELVENLSYGIIFWAQVKDAGHYVTTDLRNITEANFTTEGAAKRLSNDESRAAFYKVFTFTTDDEKSDVFKVELVRPFAQLNLGTTKASLINMTDYKVSVEKSTVTVKGISSSFNTVTGKAGAVSNTSYTFAQNVLPEGDLKTNIDTYAYMAMNYIFVPETGTNIDVTYNLATKTNNIAGSIERTVNSVPVKPNYRTNIVGNLLTAEASLSVEIDQLFTTPDIDNDAILKEQLAKGGNVVLHGDVALDEIIVPEKDAVIDLNGFTISSTEELYVAGKASALISVPAGVTVTIKNGNVNALLDYAVEARGGKLIIESGSYTGACTSVYAVDGGTVEIKGGEFDIQDDEAKQKYGTTYLLNLKDNTGSSIAVSGGSFKGYNPAASLSENPQQNFLAPGYTSVYDAETDSYNVVAVEDIIAKGGVITLAADMVVKGEATSSDLAEDKKLYINKNTTIDLNGYTLKYEGADRLFRVNEGATLTFQNGNLEVAPADVDASTTAGYIASTTGGDIVVNGGTYTVKGCTVFHADKGFIYVNGGEFKAEEAYATPGKYGWRYTFNCSDDNYRNGTAGIVIKGGKFYKFNPADNASEGAGTNYVAAGYTAVAEGDWFVVKADAGSLTESLAGGTVVLNEDVEAQSTIKIDGGVLDGNGKTIETAEMSDYSKPSFNITGGVIKNVTIEGNKYSVAADALTSDLTIDNVVIDKTGYCINIRGGSSDQANLYVKNSTLYGWSSYAGIKSVTFENVNFRKGTYWSDDVFNDTVKPYVSVRFENCDFEKGFNIDLEMLSAGQTVVIKDCTVDGQYLASDNIRYLLEGYDQVNANYPEADNDLFKLIRFE